jgi:Spy/CpxP family protein refolding chaperone
MKRFIWLLAVVALAVMVMPALAADGEKKNAAEKPVKEKPAKDALRGEYGIMTSECGLSAEQQAAVKAALEKRDAALTAWEETNGAKRTALMEQAKKAKESGDKDASKKAGEEMKALTAERDKAQADCQAAIAATLTPEQQSKWQSFRAYRSLMGRYKKCEPTEEQQAKMREAASKAAAQLAAVQGDDKDARVARGLIESRLTQTVEQDILTPAQRDMLPKKGEAPAKPAGEKKDKKAEG